MSVSVRRGENHSTTESTPNNPKGGNNIFFTFFFNNIKSLLYVGVAILYRDTVLPEMFVWLHLIKLSHG